MERTRAEEATQSISVVGGAMVPMGLYRSLGNLEENAVHVLLKNPRRSEIHCTMYVLMYLGVSKNETQIATRGRP